VDAGIDEAGRGPVVGPLVVGLVAGSARRLAALGVKDSKVLSRGRRELLDQRIREVAERIEVVELPAGEIDARMGRRSLNVVEVELFAELGRRVEASTYYLDACDTNAKRFGTRFGAMLLREPLPRVVSEHGADGRYPLVAAASIVAKVHRDRALQRIAERLEPRVGLPLGSGYSHDARTRAFLARYLELHSELPVEARAAWATSKDLTAARWQRTLPGMGPPTTG
jgi:ribonuclease HII